MNITLQATGQSPQNICYTQSITSTQMLMGDKRGVRLTVYLVEGENYWFPELTYITSWGSEREFVRHWVWVGMGDTWHHWVRRQSKNMLPPGAGFPATPQYDTRQSKLNGMLEVATLEALGAVLREIPV